MKPTDLDSLQPADQHLDRLLSDMAEETPPMPADFHDRWMKAIRAEAEQAVAGAGQAAEAPEETTGRRPVSLTRWTRVLSVAAVFVFLIGGTLLYRRGGETLTADFRAAEKATETAADADRTMDEDMALAMDEDMALAMDEDADRMMSADEETALAMDEGADLATEMEMEEAGEAEAALPEENAFVREVGAFLTDMGHFLLAALPYLAVLAVPAVIALALKRKKKESAR